MSEAFWNEQIQWPDNMTEIKFYEFSTNIEIGFMTNDFPSDCDDYQMEALSKEYPSVVFHFDTGFDAGAYDIEYDPSYDRKNSVWFCNSKKISKKTVEKSHKEAYKSEVERFINATDIAADGIEHRVELMPNGMVAADGKNQFGECNILPWTNIKQISCGNRHTVALRDDGTVLACGSNVNGQCDVSDISEKAIAVSCGRYHTAILLDSGQVVVRGKLEQEAQDDFMRNLSPLCSYDFPLEENLYLNKYVSGWEEMNERIEHISEGEDLIIKKISENDEINFYVYNMQEEKLGKLNFYSKTESFLKLFPNIKASVATVKPLSKRRKGAKYAAMTIRLDYVADEKPEQSSEITFRRR